MSYFRDTSVSFLRTSNKVQPQVEEEEKGGSVSIDKKTEARSSKYDIPIHYFEDAQYHKQFRSIDAVHSLFSKKSTSSILSTSHYSDRQKSSMFQYLKEEVLKNSLKGRQSFTYLKKPSVQKLKCDVHKQLMVLYNAKFCESTKPWPPENMPSTIYRWSQQDFLERTEKNDIWVGVLLRDRSEKCLHFYKYQTDIEELIKYLNMIFECFLTDDPNFDCTKNIYNKINEVYEFLSIYKELIRHYKQDDSYFQYLLHKILENTLTKRQSKTTQNQELNEKLMLTEFLDPIEVRYQIRYNSNKTAQSELKIEILENKYLKDIQKLQDEMQRDNYCSQCACNCLYIDIENYKNRITLLTEQYDKEYEAIDNKIQFYTLAIEKIRDQRKFMEEQIERFHEEIESMKSREIAEKAEKDRQIKEKLEAELREIEENKMRKKEKKAKKKIKKT